MRQHQLIAFLIATLCLIPQMQAQELGTPQSKPVTIQGNEMGLRQALEQLAKQTGHLVEDRRMSQDDTKIKLDLKKVTFWQAVDAIAKAADARVSNNERDGKVALLDGPYKLVPISYDGIFRATITRIVVLQSIDMDVHQCRITMEIAWEPGFQPLMMDPKSDELTLIDDKGRTIEVPESGRGTIPISRKMSSELTFVTNAPARSAQKLATLKGKVGVVGPSKMLEFSFDKLAQITKKAEHRKLTQDGVNVTLRELRAEGPEGDQIWTAALLLEYPDDGPKFESFQSWIVNNEALLSKEKDGLQQRFPPNLGYETEEVNATRALIKYRFGDEPEKKLVLGKYPDWKLIYRTPGKISEIPVQFEFKDVQLP